MHDPKVVAFELKWPNITVWHKEPGGRDSGEVCRHYITRQLPDGSQRTVVTNGWKYHVHHWKLQVHCLQRLRRRLLTRCDWCGGRSHKGDPVNCSRGLGGPRAPWWRGERGLEHVDCDSYRAAHERCLCDTPDLPGPEENNRGCLCSYCGQRYSGPIAPGLRARLLLLVTVPVGQRDPAVYAEVIRMFREELNSGNAAW